MARREVSVISSLVKSLPRSCSFLVAVSGGIDSVVLLDGLLRVKKLLKADVGVAHVDHNLRPESSEDADFVRQLCLSNKVNYYEIRLNPAEKDSNTEEWGRKERYRFLKKIRLENSYDYILTAHHSSDVAENFLMRLVSNKELRGIDIFDSRRALIRPLLKVTKDQILKHQKRFNLKYKQDSSNSDNSFLRNRVRNRLIPLLEDEFQKKAQLFIAEKAIEMAEDLHALETLAQEHYSIISDKNIEQSREFLCSLATPICWRVIDLYFLGKLGYRLGRNKCMIIRQFLSGSPRKIDLPDGKKLYWQKKSIKMNF